VIDSEINWFQNLGPVLRAMVNSKDVNGRSALKTKHAFSFLLDLPK
jgi:hypothetical protein